jgi:survival-of-motor-neuron-related-splicing factor 30
MGESLEEIGERLRFLLEQYKQVELALGQDPQNEELLNARKELQEIVTLTEDLYNIKKAESMPRPPPVAAPPVPAYHAAPPAPTSAWPAGGAPPPQPPGAPFAVGSRVQAIYQADGLWYEAVIDAITDDGIYKITFLGYGNKQDTRLTEMREPVAAPPPKPEGEKKKRTKVEDVFETNEAGEFVVPKNLQILPNDSDEVKAKKKRKIKSLKDKFRMRRAEKARSEKQNTWKKFADKKATKRKVGFMTGMRKESIFKTSDSFTGKVGVTGSGKEMTKQMEDIRVKYKKKMAVPSPSALDANLGSL